MVGNQFERVKRKVAALGGEEEEERDGRSGVMKIGQRAGGRGHAALRQMH